MKQNKKGRRGHDKEYKYASDRDFKERETLGDKRNYTNLISHQKDYIQFYH